MTEPTQQTAAPAPAASQPPPPHHWFHKLSAVVFIIFCLELGLFLIIYPWTEGWGHNLFASSLPFANWNIWWHSPFLKGALSGLGILDVWVSVGEIFRLRRFVNPS